MKIAARLVATLIVATSPAVLADPTPTTESTPEAKATDTTDTTEPTTTPETADELIATAPLECLPSLTEALRCWVVDLPTVCSNLHEELTVTSSSSESTLLQQSITNLGCGLVKLYSYCPPESYDFPQVDAGCGELLKENIVIKPSPIEAKGG